MADSCRELCDMKRVQSYQESLMIMNSELLFSGPVFIPGYRHGDIPIAVMVD